MWFVGLDHFQLDIAHVYHNMHSPVVIDDQALVEVHHRLLIVDPLQQVVVAVVVVAVVVVAVVVVAIVVVVVLPGDILI
jgi:hypothetical protein